MDLNGSNPAHVKLCECGCGQPAPIARKTNLKLGHIKGQPVRFCPGHNLVPLRGKEHPRWKGGRFKIANGYIRVSLNGKTKFEHHVIAEEILGRPLLLGEVVHHINGDKGDNRPENLLIINQSLHAKLHFPKGQAKYLPPEKKCPKCGITKPSSAFARDKTRADGLNGWCKSCQLEAKRRWKNNVKLSRLQRKTNRSG